MQFTTYKHLVHCILCFSLKQVTIPLTEYRDIIKRSKLVIYSKLRIRLWRFLLKLREINAKEVNELDLHYKEYGDKNASLMVFLHGGGVSSWMWDEQIQ